MLPPLNQTADGRVGFDAVSAGPTKDAVPRPAAPIGRPTVACSSSTRRVSLAKATPSPSLTGVLAYASPRRATLRPARPVSVAATPQPLTPGTATVLESFSRIPREFFVIETNAVLPQTQYPPAHYQSTFIGGGAWETVVFPALAPHTRQQVLCLWQTLEAMRARSVADGFAPTTATAEFAEAEWALHSLCFHELARQIRFICKEQSELLFEIQAAYDATISRLVTRVKQLEEDSEREHAQTQRLQRELQACKQQLMDQTTQREATDSPPPCERCSCDRRSSRGRWERHHADEEGEKDDEDDDDDELAWRTFQRQRRQRMHEFEFESDCGSDGNSQDGSAGGGGGGRLQRASIVAENTAAARVQQAFAKYQQRQNERRMLLRQAKKDAARDIQRSYRGYRERQRALHHRAVMYTILKRRKEVAAVELLQMNVRAYLLKKRREFKNGGGTDSTKANQSTNVTVAQKSMFEAKRAGAPASAFQSAFADHHPISSGGDLATDDLLAPVDLTKQRLSQLLNGLSELAAAFSFLHSRRQLGKQSVETSKASEVSVGVATQQASEDHAFSNVATIWSNAISPAEAAAQDKILIDETMKRAEDLMSSFRSVLSELRREGNDGEQEEEKGQANGLCKATSTTSLPVVPENTTTHRGGDETPDLLGSAGFLFLDDDRETPPPRRASSGSASLGREQSDEPYDDLEDDDDGESTHLDDVLWQSSVFTPRRAEEIEDEASARALLERELLASRDQQKRHAALKQFIADIYDTLVGRLRELPRPRLQKLIRVHGSLALSFADGRRVLRSCRHHRHRHPLGGVGHEPAYSEYEPISAFVGRVDLNELIHDHFHCQLGLKLMVDAAKQRVVADLRQFQSLDPDVQRFHDYLMRERSPDDLVFFCLCRLLARDSPRGRQPAFHETTMRELVDVLSAMEVARGFFLAAGDDASMVRTDAFVIEPSNEIYACHLPSRGLQQLEAILLSHVTPVDASDLGDGGRVLPPLGDDRCPHVRSSNVNQFHARVHNASAARSPTMRRPQAQPPAAASWGASEPNSCVGHARWVFFGELVDLLRRYRSVMRHFHEFIQWTHELFHEAFRRQKLEQTVGASPHSKSPPLSTGSPLLEEAAFVETLVAYSLGASERELRNIFHNALKQRHLQRVMPVRVFVSVVLVLLRNGHLSVTSYKPLENSAETRNRPSQPLIDHPCLAAQHREREDKQWMHLALRWRAQEQRFEATVERLHSTLPSSLDDASSTPESRHQAAASRLVHWRNELYELFIARSGRRSMARAQSLYEQLLEGMADTNNDSDETAALSERDEATGGHVPDPRAEAMAFVVGSPWATS